MKEIGKLCFLLSSEIEQQTNKQTNVDSSTFLVEASFEMYEQNDAATQLIPTSTINKI